MKNIWTVLTLCLCLSSCSVYEDTFKCPIGKGEQCRSLSYVDQKADQGAYTQEPSFEEPKSAQEPASLTIFLPRTGERLDLDLREKA